jgi:hypothetical protein
MIVVRIATSMLMLAALVLAGCGGGAPEAADYQRWRPLLAAELARAAVDRPEDLYKFLYQGVMGPAHAAPSTDHARSWIAREWTESRGLPAMNRPPLLQPLRPDGGLARIDIVRLRQLVGADEAMAMDDLAEAFVYTADTWTRRPEHLAALWAAVTTDTTLWRGHFAAIDLEHFERERAGAWPAVHHSDSYRARMAPHYRVVDPTLLPAHWSSP